MPFAKNFCFNLKAGARSFARGAVCLSLILLPFSFAHQATAESTDAKYAAEASAYDLQTNKLLYREHHSRGDANNKLTVRYTTPSGRLFAVKTLTFGSRSHQPEVELQDYRHNETVSVSRRGKSFVLVHTQPDSRKEKSLAREPSLVIDAGLDSFIRQNWSPLAAGQHLRFDYVVPTRMRSVTLQVQEIPATSSPLSVGSKGMRYFAITPAGRPLSFFSRTMHLAYSSRDRKLRAFSGRSSLTNDNGGSWDVKVEYQY